MVDSSTQMDKITIVACAVLLSLVLFSSVATSILSTVISNYGSITFAQPLRAVGNQLLLGNGTRFIPRGVVYTYFMDGPNGSWLLPSGAIEWNTYDQTAIGTYLDFMKSWGVNYITVFSTAEWWIRNTNNFQSHIKYFIQQAGSRGIYVGLTWWTANGTNAGWSNWGTPSATFTGNSYQNTAPFPPYDHNNVINSTADITNMWSDIANQLKGYPNVIFEIWDEPNTNAPVGPTWFGLFQNCITAIRATGATNLIDICYGDTLNYGAQAASQGYIVGFDWVALNPLNDSLQNLMYDQHHYMDTFYNETVGPYGVYEVSTYSEILEGFNKTGTLSLAQTKPVFIGETGCNLYRGNQTMEINAFNNTLEVLNDYDIGFNVFASPPYVSGTAWGLVQGGQTNYTLNTPGQILKQHLANAVRP